ncbi:hypothetical protein ATY81_00025 [Rhizobium sp. R72]|nr:hypothetical protein ATY81_00025 [Rhizobium sp. R72]OWW05489.1 hypothetical protein ATY80_00025 [Rhizobium sp. R711]
MDLDIAPEEFDALAPNIMVTSRGERLPYLQISEALPNGSGFCRHLLGDSTIPVAGLIKSILDEVEEWPRRAVADPSYDAGFDGNYDCFEVSDWAASAVDRSLDEINGR